MKAWLEQTSPQLACLNGVLSFDSVRDVEYQGVQFLSLDVPECTIDLAGVSYSDSAGLALLLAWYREALKQGKSIRFTAPPANMLALLAVSGLDELISFS